MTTFFFLFLINFLCVGQISAILSGSVLLIVMSTDKAFELLTDILRVPLEEKAWKTVSYKTHTYFYCRT